MTHKFWNDWKRRFGETKQIIIKNSSNGENLHGLFSQWDRIIDAEFHNDYVTIIYDTFFDDGTRICQRKETLHRDQIGSVVFKKHN